MPRRLYCPQCLSFGDPKADFCTSCGAKLIPLMRVVIMPFVESGQEPDALGDHKGLVEREGELQPAQAIGCQMYMASDLEKPRLIISQKEVYFSEAERMLPNLVKSFLDPLGFYDIPDPGEVDLVTEKAAHMPTELFVLIQNQYDPEYLFLPCLCQCPGIREFFKESGCDQVDTLIRALGRKDDSHHQLVGIGILQLRLRFRHMAEEVLDKKTESLSFGHDCKICQK